MGEAVFRILEGTFKVLERNVAYLIMKTVLYSETLFYCDGPQVILAHDDCDQKYVGVMVGSEVGEGEFVLGAVAPHEIDAFQAGLIDLRSLFLEHPDGKWYLGTPIRVGDERLKLESQAGPIEESHLLPASGFFLSGSETQKENPLGRETEGVSAGKPLEIGPPPLRREVGESSPNFN